MSTTEKNLFGLYKKVATGRGLGKDEVQSKSGQTMEQEAEYFHGMYDKEGVGGRKNSAQKMVDVFYDLVTDFYESGWGQSFHFAPRGQTETFRESITRHEHYIASKLELSREDYVLDAGCGIGGPMRNIAQFSGSKILGITINSYQVKRGNELNKSVGLGHLCELQERDFVKTGLPDNTFDKIFCIEASCHSPERRDVFGEMYRVLKPGGLFGTYEWVLTDKFDGKDPVHLKSKKDIEKGNALPDLISATEATKALTDVGFELVLAEDVAEVTTKNNQNPWYGSLESKCSLETLPHTSIGMMITDWMCWTLEKVGLAPKGTYKTHQVLLTARDGLVIGGQTGIFTPMLLLVGRKPL